MAAQLNTQRLNRLFSRAEDVHIPVGVLTIVCAAAVIISLASILVGTWSARRDEDTAIQRYVDTQALLALPPVDITALEAERQEAAAALAEAQAAVDLPSIDPSSDSATSLLIRSAEREGLTVTGVNRVASGQLKDDLVAYDVQGVRITVDGGINQIISFLAAMYEDEPGFIPSLGALNVDGGGLAHAELVFSVYTEVVPPTPIPPVEAAP